MGDLNTARWTVEQERQLWEEEEEFNRNTTIRYKISKADRYSNITRPELQISFDQFAQKKDSDQLRKIRGGTLYDEIVLGSIGTDLEAEANMLSSCGGSEGRLLHLIGQDSLPQLNKKMIRTLTLFASKASVDLQIILRKFLFHHKQFWRILFAMRQTKYAQIVSCSLQDIGAIGETFSIDEFTSKQFSLEFLKFIISNNSEVENKKALPLVDTLAIMKNYGLQSEIPLNLIWRSIETTVKDLVEYVKSEEISDHIKISI